MDCCGWVIPLFAFLLYTNTFDADFVYDDRFGQEIFRTDVRGGKKEEENNTTLGAGKRETLLSFSRVIVRNPDVQGSTSITDLVQNDFWGLPLTSPGSHGSYRPLTVLSFRVTAFLAGGVRPRWFHVGNALLHGLATALVFRLARRCLPSVVSAAAAATLFAVHPVHCEAVAGVVGRADLLACVMTLSTILIFMQSVHEDYDKKIIGKRTGKPRVLRSTRRRFVSLSVWVLSTAAVLSKETGISALPLCAVYEALLQLRNLQNQRSLKIGPLIFLSSSFAMHLVGRIWLLGGRVPRFAAADNPAAHHPQVLTRTLTFLHLPVVNLRLLLWPMELSFDWSMDAVPRISSLEDSRNVGTVAILGGVILVILRAIWRLLQQRGSSFGQLDSVESGLLALAIIIVPLLPASNMFFYVGFVVAERILYLPSVGFSILVALGAHSWATTGSGGPWRKRLVTVGFVVLVASMAARTLRRNLDWLNEESLYRAGIPVNPPKAYGNLGSVLSSQGRLHEAELAFNLALKYRPNMADVHYNLGNLLLRRNRLEDAVWRYKQAIYYRPSLAQAHLQLGRTHLAAGRAALAAVTLWQCAALPVGDVRDPVAHRTASATALRLLNQLLSSSGKPETLSVTTGTRPGKQTTQPVVKIITRLRQRYRFDVEPGISGRDVLNGRENSSVQDTRSPMESWIVASSTRENASLCETQEMGKL